MEWWFPSGLFARNSHLQKGDSSHLVLSLSACGLSCCFMNQSSRMPENTIKLGFRRPSRKARHVRLLWQKKAFLKRHFFTTNFYGSWKRAGSSSRFLHSKKRMFAILQNTYFETVYSKTSMATVTSGKGCVGGRAIEKRQPANYNCFTCLA